MASKSIYPSIPAPGGNMETLVPTVNAMRQTINMLIMNAQAPDPNYTPSSASQVFVTYAALEKMKTVGPAGPQGPVGPSGPSGPPGAPGVGFPDAPANGTTYGRNNNAWMAVSGGGGGIADAPADSSTYARNNSAWVHLTHNDITDWAFSISQPSNTPPTMAGAAAAGASMLYSRGDHVHPTDTSRYAASNPAGYQTAAQVSASLGSYLPLAGGNMTGNIMMSGNVSNRYIGGATSGSLRWVVQYGDNTPETGSNSGSYFTILSFPDSGSPPTTRLTMTRNGQTQIANDLSVGGAISVGGQLIAAGPSNLRIAGGTNGQVLTTDGASNLSWTTPSGGGGIADAPNDGTAYARKSAAWSNLATSDLTDWGSAAIDCGTF